MKIGVVELDTSHPQNWIPVERALGHEVVGVYDTGAIRPNGYAQEFAKEFEIPRVYETLEEMAEDVDCAILHSCNWDTHVEKARPFVEAGKSVLIDKPVAGKPADFEVLCEWMKQGARISGGSSLRFCYETQDWLAQPVSERGEPVTVVCGCGNDEYNYGIHAYALLSGILGPGIESVQFLCGDEQRRILVRRQDGKTGVLILGVNEVWLPFHATIVTDKNVSQFQVDSAKLYEALLKAVLPYLGGETDEPPLPFRTWIEPELCAIAARRSMLEGGREVALKELAVDDEGYDGKEFERRYWKVRNPG